MERNEERILTRLRKLASKWSGRHRTVVLDYDDYLSIGLLAMLETKKTWAGTDPLLLEALIMRRANWDMCSAARDSMRRQKLLSRTGIASDTQEEEDPIFTDEVRRQDLRDVLTKSLPPREAQLAIAYLVDEKTLSEIAKESGLPTTTIHSRWESIRQQMKTNPHILRFLEDCKDG